eukprot:TRINITY_DN4074_c0_g1_i1.p1 TRINITY_DN4074_c0_g1~~TRINITY_DN4074_c0_g1_i1.p1  ORF type:complete len:120 (-),score=4.57 TRINITY_DN4074_c0_g1_i1:31-390(-)
MMEMYVGKAGNYFILEGCTTLAKANGFSMYTTLRTPGSVQMQVFVYPEATDPSDAIHGWMVSCTRTNPRHQIAFTVGLLLWVIHLARFTSHTFATRLQRQHKQPDLALTVVCSPQYVIV